MKYIYLLKGTKDFYKIGITQNISTRLHNINTSNHDEIFVVTSKLVEDAPILETSLHQKYAIKRTKSEWFQFTPEEALEVCIEIHKAPGFIEKPADRQVKESMQLLTKTQEELNLHIREIKKELLRINPPKPKVITPPIEEVERATSPSHKKRLTDEEMANLVKDTIMKYNHASASFLQRKLRIGYSRAARILDMLADEGIVSKGKIGESKPREVLVKSL